MREALRESEEKVFNALADFIKLNAYPPTIRELCNLTEITSTCSVHAILKSLETKGYIKTVKNQRRALSIVSTTADMVEVKHGKWINVQDFGGGKCLADCSICRTQEKAPNPTALKMFRRYCSYCGAKMDLKEGETNA